MRGQHPNQVPSMAILKSHKLRQFVTQGYYGYSLVHAASFLVPFIVTQQIVKDRGFPYTIFSSEVCI